jgi:hypothetical protein
MIRLAWMVMAFEKVLYRRSEMERAHPDAAVCDYEALMPAMTNHEKARHVLAASVKTFSNSTNEPSWMRFAI